MQATIWLLATAAALAGPEVAQNPAGKAVLPRCLVELIDEAELPAQEAGRLVAIEGEEGLVVEKDAVIARIDDEQSRSELLVAEKEEEVARVQAESDIEEQVALKAAKLAMAEYEQVIEANTKAAGAKTEAEKRIKLFQYEKARLQYLKAQQDRSIAKTTVEARVAQVKQAQTNVKRREIVAPLSGEIAKVYLHLGEWAAPGAPVLRIVRLDRLRVKGFIDPKQFAPSEVVNRTVSFETELARGRKERFTGKITYVNFEIEPTGLVSIWAEVINRKEAEQWLLRPGTTGELTIDINGPPAAVTNHRLTPTPEPAAEVTPEPASTPKLSAIPAARKSAAGK